MPEEEAATTSTVASGVATVDWCRRCNLSRTTVPLWALTPTGVYPIGHRVDCGCYR